MSLLWVVEWDAESLTAAVCETAGTELRATRYEHAAVPTDPPPGDPARWLQDQLARWGVAGQPVVMVLPREKVVVRRLEIPDVPDDEVAGLVRFQAAAKTSLGLDDLVLDYLLLPRRPDRPQRDVLIATLSKAHVQEWRQSVEQAGGQLQKILFSSTAAVELAARLPEPGETAGHQWIVTRHGPRIEIAVAAGTQLVFTHSSRLSASPEAFAGALAAEIARTRVAFQALDSTARIGRFWLLGDEAEFPQASELLAARFNAPAVRVAPRTLLAAGSQVPDGAAGLAPLVGGAWAALAPRGPTLDFLAPRKPPVKVDTHGQQRRLRIIAAAGVAAVILCGYLLRLQSLDAALATRQDQLAKLKRKIQEGAPTVKTAAAYQEWEAARRRWLDDMSGVARHLPPTDRLYLTTWRCEPQVRDTPARIRAEGYARERADVVSMKERVLRESPDYQIVPHGIRAAERDQYYPWQFEAELLLTPKKPTRPGAGPRVAATP